MGIYSVGHAVSISTVNAAAIDLLAFSPQYLRSIRLYEFSVLTTSAVAATFGLGRPANDGVVVQTSPTTLQAENPNDPASQTTIATTWSTAPTQPAVYIRRFATQAVSTHGIIMTWMRGLLVPAQRGIVAWNLIAGSNVMITNWIVDE